LDGLLPLLPLLPLGLLAGILSGLLGIGGGLIFAPLLLLAGLEPHHALATSTLAIVPTTLGGTLAHLRRRSLPAGPGLTVAAAAALAAAVFSRLGRGAQGWQLLGLQALLYALLCIVIRPRSRLAEVAAAAPPVPRAGPGLALVGAVAGVSGGLLGIGGGLVMVPLMVQGLGMAMHQAIRLSTLAVLASAATAAAAFLADGRADPIAGLLLGGTAAAAAAWSGSRLDRVSEDRLAWMLRSLTLLLSLDSGRRALALLLGG
jgi:hypothetical protein